MKANREGNGAGPKDEVFVSAMHGFVLPHPRMMGKTFLPHSRPKGSYEAPFHTVKLYFLLILQLV